MIWVSWRQHRSEAVGSLALLGVLAVLLVLVSTPMRAAFSQDGIAACLARGSAGGCQGGIQSFISAYGLTFNQLLGVLILLPGLIGAVVGAPLLGREFERGTWRMAWSQTVPRTRWLTTRLGLVSGDLVLLGAAMTAVFTWYRGPMDRLTGHFISAAFDFEGLALTAYLLCAFAFAVLAGLLMRRSIGAMVTAFFAWATVRGLVELWLRPRFQHPLTRALPRSAGTHYGPNVVPPMTGHLGDWVLGVTTTASNQLIRYQPASRFWDFQLMEGGLFLVLAAAALGAAVLILHRRVA
jgi:hypothetical protein